MSVLHLLVSVRNLRTPGFFAGHQAIVAACSISVTVFAFNCELISAKHNEFPGRCLLILYNREGAHYDSLRALGDDSSHPTDFDTASVLALLDEQERNRKRLEKYMVSYCCKFVEVTRLVLNRFCIAIS